MAKATKQRTEKQRTVRSMRTKVQKDKTRPCPGCDGRGSIADRRKDPSTVEIRDIADAVELHQSSVSRFFSDNQRTKRDTTFRRAMRIADYLGITLDELRVIVE